MTSDKIAARSKAFVSYSHKDKRLLSLFLPFFAHLERDAKLDIWHDAKIQAGAPWREEIRGAIERCRIALLLVSQEYPGIAVHRQR